MPYIRVLEVATFYTQFMLQPVGTKAHIQVCGTTPCMLRGSEELMKVCKRKINEKQFETNAEGHAFLGRSRMPGCLRECADGDDFQGYLRRFDSGTA